MGNTTPSYLTKRNGIYYFQTRIPVGSVQNNGRKYKLFRRSTRTGNRQEALKIARIWWVMVMGDIADKDFEELSRQQAEADYKSQLYHRGKILFQAIDGTDPNDPYLLEQITQDWTPEDIKAFKFFEENRPPDTNKKTPSPQPATDDNQPAPGPMLSEAAEQYFAFNDQRQKPWAAKTKAKYQSHVALFIEMVGDRPVGQLSKAIVRDQYGDRLPLIPIRINQEARFKDGNKRKSLEDVLRITQKTKAPTLSASSIVSHVKAVTGFLKWLSKRDQLKGDCYIVLEDLSKLANSDERNEKKFTTEELKKIFESPDYQSGKLMRKPARYWAPLIGIFTGARLGEICQLHISDIIYDKETGIWLFDFNRDGTKSLKNSYSERAVPIHNTLIELGFLSFVERAKKRRQKLLFPRAGKDKYGNMGRNVSRWFNGEKTGSSQKKPGFLKQCGIKESENQRKNFHSLRHTVINYAKQTHIDGKVIRELTGHSTGRKDVHDKHYEDPYELNIRKETIERIQFDVDFQSIKKWPR